MKPFRFLGKGKPPAPSGQQEDSDSWQSEDWKDTLIDYEEPEYYDPKIEDPVKEEEREQQRKDEIKREEKLIDEETHEEMEVEENTIYESLVLYFGVMLIGTSAIVYIIDNFRVSRPMIFLAIMGAVIFFGALVWRNFLKHRK